MITEKSVPVKIAIPPREGVLIECDLLSLGSSTRFFLIAICMIGGIARYVSAKEVTKAKTISYINFKFQRKVINLFWDTYQFKRRFIRIFFGLNVRRWLFARTICHFRENIKNTQILYWPFFFKSADHVRLVIFWVRSCHLAAKILLFPLTTSFSFTLISEERGKNMSTLEPNLMNPISSPCRQGFFSTA